MIRFLFQQSIPKRIAASFAIVILVGSLLLNLPISQLETSQATYFDHLFTTVSMVCVTGLFTQPVASTYNSFGQIICMFLMQIGGLGLMSMIAFFFFDSGKKLSLTDRLALQDSLNRDDTKDFKDYLRTIFKYTFIIEGIAAILFMIRFIPMLGVGKGIFTSIFFAISAFCNAGFDNLGSNSLIDYATDPLLAIVISALIILGGIGFAVWFDVKNSISCYRSSLKNKYHKMFYKRLHYHTKVVILLTLGILLTGTFLTLITEWHNPDTIGNLNFGQKLLVSFFQTVTMRTAGFASIDYTKANPSTLLLYCIQMFIGGSPGGTAGGVKTTTVLVVLLFIRSEIYEKKSINFRHHTIPYEMARKSLMIFIIFTVLTLSSVFLLTITDPQAPLLYTLFETISAMCTVGVTANLTPTLSMLGQIIIMTLMFIGRIGPLTVLLSFSNRKKQESKIEYAKAPLLIG